MKRKKVTMNDVSRLANVSQSTVSMILGKKRDLSLFPQSTVNKVIEAAQQLNYRPKESIIKQPNNKPDNKTILVVAVKMTRQDYSGMLQAIEIDAFENGYNVLTCNTYHNPSIEERYLQFAVEEKFSGIIYIYPPDNLPAFNEVKDKIPIITICDSNTNFNADIVEINNYQIGIISVRHLLDLGHKHVAFLTYPINETLSRIGRFEGIKAELAKDNLLENLTVCVKNTPSNEILGNNDYEFHAGEELANDKCLLENNVTGIICVNDMLALGVMSQLLKSGHKIPRDFSVIGFGNLFFDNYLSVPLTTVDPYMTLAAHSAFEILMHKIKIFSSDNNLQNLAVKFKTECTPKLIIRKSTGPIRINN
ncbi:MAG: LacI family DNA-binding transcriptional regulator [Spirochaetia bacterium]|nr:LacI family DNA-binding transcriptional regulator [Spirochaetia bacterium]